MAQANYHRFLCDEAQHETLKWGVNLLMIYFIAKKNKDFQSKYYKFEEWMEKRWSISVSAECFRLFSMFSNGQFLCHWFLRLFNDIQLFRLIFNISMIFNGFDRIFNLFRCFTMIFNEFNDVQCLSMIFSEYCLIFSDFFLTFYFNIDCWTWRYSTPLNWETNDHLICASFCMHFKQKMLKQWFSEL